MLRWWSCFTDHAFSICTVPCKIVSSRYFFFFRWSLLLTFTNMALFFVPHLYSSALSLSVTLSTLADGPLSLPILTPPHTIPQNHFSPLPSPLRHPLLTPLSLTTPHHSSYHSPESPLTTPTHPPQSTILHHSSPLPLTSHYSPSHHHRPLPTLPTSSDLIPPLTTL